MGASTEMKQRADLSDHLAAERTFLAWIRTGLALTGFGFLLARFSLILQETQYTRHIPSARPFEMSPWFGTVLIAVGVIVYLLSAWHHLRLVRELDRGGPFPSRPSTKVIRSNREHRNSMHIGRRHRMKRIALLLVAVIALAGVVAWYMAPQAFRSAPRSSWK